MGRVSSRLEEVVGQPVNPALTKKVRQTDRWHIMF
jgi:hypothetical protein